MSQPVSPRRHLAWMAVGLAVLLDAGISRAELQFDAGVLAGLSRASVSGEAVSETDLESKTSFLVGGTFGLGLPSSIRLSLEPSYVRRGCSILTVVDDRNDIEEETGVRLDYLELPLLLRVRGSGQTRPYAVGGFGLTFLLDASAERPGGDTVDISDDLHSTGVMAYFGGGVEKEWGSQEIFIEARYSQGLTDASRGGSTVSLPGDFKNTALQLVAGWKLWP